jgi:hypothetical protein
MYSTPLDFSLKKLFTSTGNRSTLAALATYRDNTLMSSCRSGSAATSLRRDFVNIKEWESKFVQIIFRAPNKFVTHDNSSLSSLVCL